VGNSRDSVVNYAYLGGKFSASQEQGHSYGGHEKNRLLLNCGGTSFSEIGFLMGVALEADSRNVVADDLDGDGRVDLLLTTMEAWPVERQSLRVFMNTLPDAGNWIGLRLREEGGGVSPVGAVVTLRSPVGVQTRQLVTGDSYRSQTGTTVHFGIGAATRVDALEIRWADGKIATLKEPAINRYHAASPNPPRR
jgi:hypothetical protein